VVFEDVSDGIVATRFEAPSTVLDAPALLLARSGQSPSVGWDGVQFVVLWLDDHGSEIRGARVTSDGVGSSTGTGPPVPPPDARGPPALACTGSTCLVVWTEAGGAVALAAHITNGAAEPPEPIAYVSDTDLAVGAGGGHFLVVVHEATET